MVVVDANILLLMLDPDANARIESRSSGAVLSAKERVEFLIEQIDEAGEKVVVPTPVLAEALVFAGQDAPVYVSAMRKFACIRIEPFDELAAIELAQMDYSDIQAGDKKGGSTDPWQKVKFDRQIVAIARVIGAENLVTDDGGLATLARASGITVRGIAELSLPPEASQGTLFGFAAGAGGEEDDPEDEQG